jgi:hypothetical protein
MLIIDWIITRAFSKSRLWIQSQENVENGDSCMATRKPQTFIAS